MQPKYYIDSDVYSELFLAHLDCELQILHKETKCEPLTIIIKRKYTLPISSLGLNVMGVYTWTVTVQNKFVRTAPLFPSLHLPSLLKSILGRRLTSVNQKTERWKQTLNMPFCYGEDYNGIH